MASNLELKAIVESSTEIKELKGKLRVAGVRKLHSSKQIRNFVYSLWKSVHEKELQEAVSKEWPPITDLPCTEVVKEGVSYCIHGILHGQEPYGLFMSSEYKSFIRNCISSYANPPKEDYLLESYFSEFLGGLGRFEEMNDMEISLLSLSFYRKVQCYLKLKSKVRQYSSKKFEQDIEKNPLLKSMFISLNDPQKIPMAREIYRLLLGVLEPLKTNLDDSCGFDPFLCSERSKIMASGMTYQAKQRGLRRIHAIVGLGHESQIVHYIQTHSS